MQISIIMPKSLIIPTLPKTIIKHKTSPSLANVFNYKVEIRAKTITCPDQP